MTAIARIQNFLDQHAQVESERGVADEIYRINAILGAKPGILLASDLRELLAIVRAADPAVMWQPETPDLRPASSL